MYTRYFFLFFLLLSGAARSQSDTKVKWKYEAVKKAGRQYEIRLTATIDKGWHLYSQQQSADAIALPTSIRMGANPFIQLKGTTKESGKLFDQMDAATRTRARYYADQVVFTQLVELKKPVKTALMGEIEFMVCDDKQCLPPGTVNFSLKLP